MKSFWKWAQQLFEDNTTGASMTRLVFFLWMLFLITHLSYVIIVTTAIPIIPESYVFITAMLAGAKVTQRVFGEKTE